MYEFFPGHYRWSYNALLALACGGQVGDIDLILNELRECTGDDALWHERWSALAAVLEARAQEAMVLGGAQSASDSLMLAALYQVIGEHFLPPSDPVRAASYDQALRYFERARQLMTPPPERIEIPFEERSLPAYFVSATRGSGPRPTVVFVCGLDTTKELFYLRVRSQFAQRGMNCLLVDTPGIGEALRRHGLVTRPDYEKPVAAILDWLCTQANVDPERIGIVGSSLGGYYVARAAAFEPRLRAAVAWGVVHDYAEVWERRLAGEGTVAAPAFQLMFVTGTSSMPEAIEAVRDFKVAPIGARVQCSFLIVHGSEDRQVFPDHVEAMFAAIGSTDKELKLFDGRSGGAAHCQFDNHAPALNYVADWLCNRLARRGSRENAIPSGLKEAS